MTQHLKLHYMRPVFTLEGRRFVSEGQEEMLREEMEKERGRRNEEECYIKGSPECLVSHHSESQFSSFSALMGEDGRRVADSPPRMFKVVLIGDSGVGKTSYIHRACTGEFRGDFGCTVGVDYRVLEVLVGGVRAVLQLWDTAGQERFRSITRQYYRKADGVVVMYDVTNEQSFLSVNDWLTSVKETAGADVSVAVLGNKCDLAGARRVPKDIAYKMIKSHNCLMYEVSAASGNGVQESIKHLAALLATQQEHDLVTSTALDLHSEEKKKKFCCRE
ncbi:ras-related protein Rab-13-like [Penaeus indicus]|uniref:ras-related protein Rab-13-like n=1 Tax=Penaeus indicus TaxID=29960 RepID=UPI00300CF2F4